MTTAASEYFTPEELVSRWNGTVQLGTLANWRVKGKRRGPPFVKIGASVLYPITGVLDWEAKNLHAANDNQPPQKDD